MKQITNKYVITAVITVLKEYITEGWSERLQEGLSEQVTFSQDLKTERDFIDTTNICKGFI